MTEFADDPQTFRAQIRAWLERHCPPEMRSPAHGEDDICWGGRRWTFRSDAQRQWLNAAAAEGLTVPGWPRAYGGAGMSSAQVQVFDDEMERIGARSPLESFGIWMLGPALLKFGTDEQKRRYLPPIARGEIRWCQGYSEPDAGSDLVALRTRAEDRGDRYVVNGQKIWTSYADQADWIFCLVRTDATAPKHRGLSFVVFDMHTPGVTTRPIKLISGKSPFCETFFENVEVPKANLIGAENGGWTVAKYLLTQEREMIAGRARGLHDGRPLWQVVQELAGDAKGRIVDPILRDRVARAEIDALALTATIERYVEDAAHGHEIGDRSSILKYCNAELNQRRQTLILEASGADGLRWDFVRSDGGEVAPAWLRAKANSIEGGTAEVMLNIVAKRLLDLPAE
ncbi:MAG: acyl-CoA dehydrogenase family protein [Gammaproteobacteria bacterium]|nr:acyl-CoA dehydrogenase family protein [Gammaproteobacteria bacterium]